MIRINLLSEARAAAARRKAPAMPTGAKLNNLLFLGAILLGVAYIVIMGLVLTSRRRHLDQEIGKARLEAERLKSIIEEVKGYEEKKASLEANVRYLARSLGPDGIRVNAISAGPIKTLAAAGIANFRKMLDHVETTAPMRRSVTIEDVGNVAAFLCSDLAAGVTGEITYVDAGYNILGMTGLE